MDIVGECDRRCKQLIGREFDGWTVKRLGVAPIPGLPEVVIDCQIVSAHVSGDFMSVKQKADLPQIHDSLGNPEALLSWLFRQRIGAQSRA